MQSFSFITALRYQMQTWIHLLLAKDSKGQKVAVLVLSYLAAAQGILVAWM